MEFINLTPHEINVRGIGTLQSQGVARVTMARQTAFWGDVRIVAQVPGPVQGLPEPKEGTAYIVSAMVLAQCKGRDDVFAPDTGPDAIRDEKGQIKEVLGLIQA